MKKFKYSLAIVFFILTTSVYSQTEGGFSHLGNYDDGTEIYIKVEKDNSFSKDLWIKQINPIKTIKNKKGKYVKSGGDIILRFLTVYCENNSYDQKNALHYTSDGKLLEQNEEYEYRYNLKVVPGSRMDKIIREICE